MASEAQRLIGLSLSKIAQSRSHRAGVSLHRNLLLATILQKARYLFMEEAYNISHYRSPTSFPRVLPQHPEKEELVATAEEVGIVAGDAEETSSLEFLQPPCEKCTDNQNKENLPPTSTELTYLDLDKSPNVLKERSNSNLKRRRAVTDWETEEAVQSILPKKSKCEEGDDSVFLDEATVLSENISKEVEAAEKTEMTQDNSTGSAMEIDRITSLVSIFSFGIGDNKLNRSVSTPDLCSSQAKETSSDVLQQRQFLAMTV